RLHPDRVRSGPGRARGHQGLGGRRGRRPVDRRIAALAGRRLPRTDRGPGGADQMSISATRIGAVIRKELAEFRRNRFILVTATILPIVFLISPTASILAIKASALSTVLSKRVDAGLFLPLLIPVFVPPL